MRSFFTRSLALSVLLLTSLPAHAQWGISAASTLKTSQITDASRDLVRQYQALNKPSRTRFLAPVIQGVQTPVGSTEAMKVVTPARVPALQLRVPEAMRVDYDFLERTTGQLLLRDGAHTIEVTAQGQACNSGQYSNEFYVRKCLKDYTDAEVQRLKDIYGYIDIQRYEAILLRDDISLSSNKKVNGWVFQAEIDRQYFAFLSFLHPETGDVYTIRIEDGVTSNLSRGTFEQRLLQSYYQQTLQRKAPTRNLQSTIDNLTTTTLPYLQRRYAGTVSVATTPLMPWYHPSWNLQLSLPEGVFSEVVANSGVWAFTQSDTAGETHIILTPTTEICNMQSPTGQKRCLTAAAEHATESFAEGLSGQQKQLTNSYNNGMRLYLQDSASNTLTAERQYYGHYTLLEDGGRRYAQLVFAEPSTGQIYLLRADAPATTKALLNQQLQFTRILTSLRFTLPEASTMLCETVVVQMSPSANRYWEQLQLDTSANPEVRRYRVQWSDGSWSGWYTPGQGDIDEKQNSDGTARRYWSYFTDHTAEAEICKQHLSALQSSAYGEITSITTTP